ncbi:hypothetical protein D1641_04245 [Colidextribacter sp. OB.20]|nr:hypothetical protein [Colidextribacter sp. OB.20]
MREGDGEANICYYCLHELHILPHEFFALPRKERAFVIAAIDERVEHEKQKAKELERKNRRGGRKGRKH